MAPPAEVRYVVPVVQDAVNRVVLLDEPLALPAVVYLAPRLLEFDYLVENSVGQRLVDVVVILADWFTRLRFFMYLFPASVASA